MRYKRILVANIVSWVAISSCGPAIPVKDNPVDSPQAELKGCKEGSAYQLGVRIISGSQSPSNSAAIPTPQFGVKLDQPTSYEKGSKVCRDQVSFPRVLNLSEDLFFVWKEEFSSKKIVMAWATHQIYTANGQWKNETAPIQSVKDLKEPRFYISINSIFDQSQFYQESNLTPADSQTLRIDLLLEDSSRPTVEIRFKAQLK